MSALYFSVLRPKTRVAVKPHASLIFHAMPYAVGIMTREKMESFGGFGGVQSNPSCTKDIDDVDFNSGSVGLGAAIPSFASMIQDYVQAKTWGKDLPLGRMIALIGDAEQDDGNTYKCLQEDGKNDLRDTWQVTDYSRQSLDRIVRKGLSERDEKFFDAFGWEVVRVKYGHLQRTAFAQAGGEKSQAWTDNGPNQLYAALTYMGGAIRCKRLMDDLSDQGHATALLEARSDSHLANRIVISSPDVTGTTNLGPWVNSRKLFARMAPTDTFKDHKIP